MYCGNPLYFLIVIRSNSTQIAYTNEQCPSVRYAVTFYTFPLQIWLYVHACVTIRSFQVWPDQRSTMKYTAYSHIHEDTQLIKRLIIEYLCLTVVSDAYGNPLETTRKSVWIWNFRPFTQLDQWFAKSNLRILLHHNAYCRDIVTV